MLDARLVNPCIALWWLGNAASLSVMCSVVSFVAWCYRTCSKTLSLNVRRDLLGAVCSNNGTGLDRTCHAHHFIFSFTF